MQIDRRKEKKATGLFRNKNNFFIDRVQYHLLLIFILFIYLFNGNKELYLLMYIPLFIFMFIELCFILKAKKIYITKHILIMFLFAFVCCLTCLWAQYKDLAMARATTVFLLTGMLALIYNYCARTKKGIEDILWILLIVGILFSVYIVCYYGIDKLSIMFTDERIRVGEEIDNVNAIGTELALTAIIAIYFGMNKDKRYYLLAAVPIVLSLSTASKKAIIYIVVGAVLLILFRRSDRFTFVDIIKKIMIPVLIILISFIVIQSNIFPSLSSRLGGFSNSFTGEGKVDGSTVTRSKFVKYGFESFLEHPIGGIGVGNSSIITLEAAGWETYLHNNYIELLATTGILGTSVYYYVFLSMLINAIKKRRTRYASIIITLLVLCLILDWGMVSFCSKITYFYILLGTMFYSDTTKEAKRYFLEEKNEVN